MKRVVGLLSVLLIFSAVGSAMLQKEDYESPPYGMYVNEDDNTSANISSQIVCDGNGNDGSSCYWDKTNDPLYAELFVETRQYDSYEFAMKSDASYIGEANVVSLGKEDKQIGSKALQFLRNESDWVYPTDNSQCAIYIDNWATISIKNIDYVNDEFDLYKGDNLVCSDVFMQGDLTTIESVTFTLDNVQFDDVTTGVLETPEIVSVSPDNQTTRFRQYSNPADLSWSVTTDGQLSGYDINLLVKRPQYSGYEREASFFDNPSGQLTTTVNRNVSGDRQRYPNGEYWFKWIVGDCVQEPDCSGSDDTLYAESEARVVELRDVQEPTFSLFDPEDGADIVGFDANYSWYVDSTIAGNVSLRINGSLVDSERVANFSHDGDGFVEYNTSYQHPSTGQYEWGVVYEALINNDVQRWSSTNLSYEILPQAAVSFEKITPDDGDVLTQDDIFLIGEVDSNRPGEIRLLVDGDSVRTCEHDGGGVVGCATPESLDLAAGASYNWSIEFEADAGEVFRSDVSSFDVVTDEDAVVNVTITEPDDNRLIRALRLFRLSFDVSSNVVGDVSAEANNVALSLCEDRNALNCPDSVRYDGGGDAQTFTRYVDAASFFEDNKSSYTVNVSFESADSSFSGYDTVDISVINGTYDYDLINPENNVSFVVGQTIDFEWRTYVVPERIGDGSVRHALVVNGEEVRNVSQFAGGWIKSEERVDTVDLRAGTNQWWIRTYNDSANPVDISEIREFTVRTVDDEAERGTVGDAIATIVLLQGTSQTTRTGVGLLYALGAGALIGWLTGSGIAFGIAAIFMMAIGAGLPQAWFPSWVSVVFAVIAGGMLAYALKS